MDELYGRFGGEVMLIGKSFGHAAEDLGFGLSWFMPLIKRYKRSDHRNAGRLVFRQPAGARLPLAFQLVIDKVLQHKSYSTLIVVMCRAGPAGHVLGNLVLPAPISAAAYRQPDRRRTWLEALLASAASADLLFREPLGWRHRDSGARTAVDPGISDGAGAAHVHRSALHLHLFRGSVRLFGDIDLGGDGDASVVHRDRLLHPPDATAIAEGEVPILGRHAEAAWSRASSESRQSSRRRSSRLFERKWEERLAAFAADELRRQATRRESVGRHEIPCRS